MLNGISLTLDKGRIMSILGPSGDGAATLLNIILGITDATGGQKQRVALARTLVMKPRLLLLDEPLSALDGVIKESIKAKIEQIVDQYNLTTIMVTHDPEEACTMSDRVLILNQGRIAQYDAPENIIEHPASDFVRDFILHQLEVKRNNIYSPFSEDHAADPADPARREPALVRA
ncbi:ATP-binding cassette domain-containing protein [Bifidobacterium pullorum]|uniref:ATP-binding cassette domain-containing protein n=1 Tax=Bifidobacterium pullorum TaxID=78448 RepID=UPI00195A597A